MKKAMFYQARDEWTLTIYKRPKGCVYIKTGSKNAEMVLIGP